MMGKIRAVFAEPTATERLVFREVDSPEAGTHEAMIKVSAISLNRGEVMRSFRSPDPFRPGWDFAGIVEQAALDGTGPQAGTRVVGLLRSGAWAEVVTVPSEALAALPDDVTFQQAATLPVAGLTALYAVEKGGILVGRRVLVTGASGGVGDFAVQLARQSGARVIGLVRQIGHRDSVLIAGAHQVVVSEDGSNAADFGPYDLVLDALGGRALSTVLTQLAPNGVCVTYSSGLTGTDIAFSSRSMARGASLHFLYIFQEVEREAAGIGLGRLASLVSAGQIRPTISVEASWNDIARVAQSLLERKFPGKAVLTVE